MDNHKVSVVIPVYNSEKFLSESLDSVLDQTYSNYEVICVDDGSTDRSKEILNQYSDKITIISQENKGLASALNTGIYAMSGKWFKWFSPDDVMYPDAIETLVNVGINHDNAIIYSNWDIIDENGKKLRRFSETNYNDLNGFDFNIRLLDGQQINVNTSLVSKSIFENGLRMNTLIDPVLVDYDFFLRSGLFYKTKFYLIEKSLIKFRVHQSQLSHQKILKSLENLKKIRDKIISELETSEKKSYVLSMKTFAKNKPYSKKTMELGLQLISNFLPNSATDKILIFYLNNIRKRR